MIRRTGFALDTLMVTCVSLAARSALFAGFSSAPLFLHPPVDGAWHHRWASLIASGDPFVFAPYFRAPLYPWILGAVYSVFGTSVTTGALFSLAVSVAGCALFHRAALSFCSRRTALAVSLCWALWAPAVFMSSTLLIEPLYMTLLLLALYLISKGRVPAASAVLGLAATARPGAILLLPLLLVPSGGRKALRLLPALLPILLVWCVNAIKGDPGVIISSQGGINLYLGNSPDSDGMTAFAPVPPDGLTVRPDNVWSASVRGAPAEASESGVSRYWTGRALSAALDDPARWAALTAWKLFLLVTPAEIPGNYDLYYMRGPAPALRFLLAPPPLFLPFSLLLLLLPAVLAAGKADKPDRTLTAWVVLLLAGVLPFFVTSRFRLPAVPFILLLYARRLERSRPRIAVLLAGLVLAGAASFASRGLVERAGVNMPFQDALAHAGEGDMKGAEALFLQSLDRSSLRSDLSMNRVEAMHNLGLIAARRGDLEGARGWWLAALDCSPGFLPSLEALDALEAITAGRVH